MEIKYCGLQMESLDFCRNRDVQLYGNSVQDLELKEAKANKIIEDIITCANVSASSEHPTIDGESSNIYIKAYHELVLYLRYLFIYYNNEIKTEELQCVINDKWGWSELFKRLNTDEGCKSVTIITYNYDIFLERILWGTWY